MHALTQPVRALVDPVDAVPEAVGAGRWLWPLLLVALAVSFSGAAFALRWNAEAAVVRELSMSGELARLTEQELSDKIVMQSRLALVSGIAKGVFLMPLAALLFALGVKFCGWLIGRPIPFSRSFSATTVALLPIAVYHLVYGVVALASASVGDRRAEGLVPSHLGHVLTGLSPEMARLASVADVFNLWAAVLLGLGYAAATGWTRPKGIAFALVLYLMWAGVFLVGLPAMGGGGR